jgi:16S rRNA (uracil1498-N3)-methyltransferase
MAIFYQADLTADHITLSEEESKHAIRVLRLRMNDRVELVDGMGLRCEGDVIDEHPKRCTLAIRSRKQEERPYTHRFHLGIAPTKHTDRMEWLVEKATEVGIERIVLLDCAHSERTQLKTERLEKIAISAMKQSQQARLPLIESIQAFEAVVAQKFDGQKFIAHCYSTAKQHLHTVCQNGQDALVLIGPEGDFSEAEVDLAIQHGFIPVSLGETRLRTETAAFTALFSVAMKSV